MTPQALALAVLLHVLVALALWGVSLDRPKPPEEAIDVTIERSKPSEALPKPPPPAPTPQARKPPPEAPARLGLRPPAEITSDKPTQVPTISEQPKEVLPPHPPSAEAKVQPQPQPPPPAPSPPTTTAALPEPALPSLPSQAPTAELAPPAKPKPPPPQSHPAPPAPQKQYYPPPNIHAAMPSPFVNPADVVNRARASDNYLWRVARKLSQYQYFAHVNVDEGTTVVRIVIARDGKLLDVRVVRSSGFPALDKGVVEGLRAGSPYAPLPADIPGDRATFNLPVVSNRR